VKFTRLDILWPSSIPKPGKIVPGGAYSIEMTHKSTGQKFKVEVEMHPFSLFDSHARVREIRLLLKVPKKVRTEEREQ
jgi:hypothetical protein